MTGWGGAALEQPVPGLRFGANPLDKGGYVKVGDLLFMLGGGALAIYGLHKRQTWVVLLGLFLVVLGFWSAFIPGGIGL